ncbi:ATP-binding protein [Massilia sp. erpn]|uniref:ATP-binding protein n=1 Tax=Massilia sp. erpn TaxID=2738142 RepID=UPI00210684D7|nr:ATP-binding protein [Massilia sp. erpn]UTY57250.1 HAMP domain-containing histidine kinase [Massilia sp. erpn]
MQLPAIFRSLPQHEALGRLVWMRAIALSFETCGVLAAALWLDVFLPIEAALVVMALLASFNMWSWWRMQNPRPVGEIGLFYQLLVDVLALSALLYLTGGATNPFVSLYLPALAVAAAILPLALALVLAIAALAAYSAMITHYVPLHVMDHHMAMNYHLVGMWINFALSAGLITWFVGRRSRTLRERDAQLALAREQHLKSAQMIALGTQAASAAHEMGTPLSTIALIADDLKHDFAQDANFAAYRADIATIETQIALCKASLQRLGAAAPGTVVPVADWLAQFIEKWRLRCPATKLKLALPPSEARIGNAQDLAQILLILLDNAAFAASRADTELAITLSVAGANAWIRIEDHGPGIARELLKRLGGEQVKSTSGGQGIGLMLAFATASQIGGRIDLTSTPGTGTTATVTIPLHEA